MKKLLFLIVLFVLVGDFFVKEQNIFLPELYFWKQDTNSNLEKAYKNKQSNIQVKGQGTVITILPDDLSGSRHQRFILRLKSGQTLFIAHNIDIAPKIRRLNKGDTIAFYGEYEWNSKGGVIHWTHHDPRNRHISGWLKHNGKTYQ